jgi:hypothetical protein
MPPRIATVITTTCALVNKRLWLLVCGAVLLFGLNSTGLLTIYPTEMRTEHVSGFSNMLWKAIYTPTIGTVGIILLFLFLFCLTIAARVCIYVVIHRQYSETKKEDPPRLFLARVYIRRILAWAIFTAVLGITGGVILVAAWQLSIFVGPVMWSLAFLFLLVVIIGAGFNAILGVIYATEPLSFRQSLRLALSIWQSRFIFLFNFVLVLVFTYALCFVAAVALFEYVREVLAITHASMPVRGMVWGLMSTLFIVCISYCNTVYTASFVVVYRDLTQKVPVEKKVEELVPQPAAT